MRSRILSSSRRPKPWDDPPGQWPVLLRPALEWTEQALVSAGVSPDTGVGETDQLLLSDDLLLSASFVAALNDVLSGRDGSTEPRAVSLGPGVSASRSGGRSPLPGAGEGGLRLPMVHWPAGLQGAPETEVELLELASSLEAIVVPAEEEIHELAVPRAYADPGSETLRLAASTRVAIHLTHRTHLLQANLELLGAHFLGALETPRFLLALRWLLDKLRPGPRRLFSRIGPGCKVHPTAIIEGSSLGAGCELGAYAIVRGSVLGEGVHVEDGAHVHASVLGQGSRVARQTSVMASVLWEGAHSAQAVMQMSVLGRHAATTSASWFADVRFGGPVRVESDEAGSLLDAGSRFVGCDVGHETVVGAGVLVAPGRMLPSGVHVVSDPAHVMSRVSEDCSAEPGSILTVRGGRLEDL